MTGCLAQIGAALDGLRNTGQGADGLIFGGEVYGGIEMDDQLVFTGLEQGFDIPAVLPEHVGGLAQAAAVQA
jgi:hypothetical protein